MGSGCRATSSRSPARWRLDSPAPNGSATNVQNLSYTWDTAGNMKQRQDLRQSLSETVDYDELNRMWRTIGPAGTFTVDYDAVGNIQSRSDVDSAPRGTPVAIRHRPLGPAPISPRRSPTARSQHSLPMRPTGRGGGRSPTTVAGRRPRSTSVGCSRSTQLPCARTGSI